MPYGACSNGRVDWNNPFGKESTGSKRVTPDVAMDDLAIIRSLSHRALASIIHVDDYFSGGSSFQNPGGLGAEALFVVN